MTEPFCVAGAGEVSVLLRKVGVGRRSWFAVLALSIVLAVQARAGVAVPPRLVVLVSVDQLAREYLQRFNALFRPGGFRRLIEGGADFRDCRHEHFPTFTAPGHAVMLTGSYPNRSGVVGNWWYSRGDHSRVGSVDDARYPILDGTTKENERSGGMGVSPLRLAVPTVGDVLRGATGSRARVVSISIKDRAAVLLGGWRPNGVYWFDSDHCRFVTSRYYARQLPAWVTRFNGGDPCSEYMGQEWRKSRPEIDYTEFADVDDAPYERDFPGFGRTFPHQVEEIPPSSNALGDRYESLMFTPFGNDLLLRFVRAALQEEQLGADDVPDLLAVGLSSNDSVGHVFGPHSQEVLDMTLRTDRQLAALMDFLDGQVGRDRWAIVVTSDHGVAPVPGYIERLGLLPERSDQYRFDSAAARDLVERRLAGKFLGDAPPRGFAGFFEAWEDRIYPFVYVDRQALQKLPRPVSFEELLAVAAQEIEALDGVARVYRRDQIPLLAASQDPIDQSVYRGWHPDSGGDLVILLEPYWLAVPPVYATSHGSPYAYDTEVPMLLYGAGITPGRYNRPVAVADLASTLAHLLGVSSPPANQGRPLFEALPNGVAGSVHEGEARD